MYSDGHAKERKKCFDNSHTVRRVQDQECKITKLRHFRHLLTYNYQAVTIFSNSLHYLTFYKNALQFMRKCTRQKDTCAVTLQSCRGIPICALKQMQGDMMPTAKCSQHVGFRGKSLTMHQLLWNSGICEPIAQPFQIPKANYGCL